MTEINYKELYEKAQGKLNSIYTEGSRELDKLSQYIKDLSPKEIIFDKASFLHDVKGYNERIQSIIDVCNSHNIMDGDRDKIKEMWEFYKIIRASLMDYENGYEKLEVYNEATIYKGYARTAMFLKSLFIDNYIEFTEKYKEK